MDLSEELKALKDLKAHRIENQRHRYFTPIGKVEEFLQLLQTGKYLIGLLSAANGIGKTYAGANVLANLIWPVGNGFFNSELFRNWPHPKKIRVVSDPTTITDTIIPTLKAVFPKGRYGFDKYTTLKNGKRFESAWTTDTGWEISLMTYEQDPKEFESATIGLIWCDEPPPLAIYKACVSRLRAGGMLFITATPLTGSAWMYDEIITNPNNEAGFRFWIEAEVEDACIDHGVRGFLTHENIDKMIAQYDPEDMQARIFGKFQHLTGLIFKKFSRKVHVVPAFDPNPRDYVIVEALDPHPRNPDAVMWVAIDRKGRKFVVDEVFRNFESDEQLAATIKKHADNYRIIRRIADPSAFVEDQNASPGVPKTLARRLANMGISYSEGSKQRMQAIRRIKESLHYVERDGIMIQAPELYVSELCTQTIYEFEHWQWDDWRGRTKELKNPREIPVDKDDHMMEDLGRILLEERVFEELPPEITMNDNPLSTNQVQTINTSLDPFA